MKRLAIAALVLFVVAGVHAHALAQTFGQAFGDLYLTNDVNDRTAICLEDGSLPAFQSHDFFLVIHIDFADIGMPNQNLGNGFAAWEAKLDISDTITLTSKTLKPASSVNVGDAGTDNWIVGTGALVSANSTPFAVVEYSGILLAPASDITGTIGGSSPSSFDDPGGPGLVPGWGEFSATGECTAKCLRAFEFWDQCENTFVLNYTGGPCDMRCPTATRETSFGSLKGRF